MSDKSKHIEIFRSLFKGREDVFAIHWEKGNKSGYMPAYRYDPYMYRLHKMKGGTFREYKDKTFQPLTDDQLLRHLSGEQLMGIYPLLKDNTSWFIAADFDKEKWERECKAFIGICKENKIDAYLERSRSGKGGHVWIFFDRPYPAIRSRKIFISLLEQAGVFSPFDKGSSFDRLFPNQNFHSGKGLGNLIALPLYRPALEKGNSCFIDARSNPYKDQWGFLSSVKKVSTSHLDSMCRSLEGKSPLAPTSVSKKLQIRLDNSVQLNRSGMIPELIDFLRAELNFANTEYFIKKKSGRSTWDTKRYFNFIDETEHEVIVPRGFIGKLIRYCRQQDIDFEFKDARKKLNPIPFETDVVLRPHQKSAIEATLRKDFGIISAPPGAGKTIIGLQIIAEKKQPALIIVHRKQLLEQWMERIQAFLGIPKSEIGKIGQGKVKIGCAVTIAMIQSLVKYLEKNEPEELVRKFTTIIVDECHHVPAESYHNAISRLCPYYQYGLTATPFRKGNDGKIISIHLGEIISDIRPQHIKSYKRARVIIRETALDMPFNSKTDRFETLSKVLVHDSNRNKLILDDIAGELKKGNRAVILIERKEHLDVLYQYLKRSFETMKLSGEDSEVDRKKKWGMLKSGNYQALITTGQLFGEGVDLQNASCLFLVYPFSFKGKLIQYIGRVQRSEVTPVIYDYRDRKIGYLDRLFLKRNTYYRSLDKQATLFDDLETPEKISKDTITIDKNIKVPIERLEFRYGSIAFDHKIPETAAALEFEIENDGIRPEFEVLKPYFSKMLGSRSVEVKIFAEFEKGSLVSQKADSTDLMKIDKELIESVRFRFVEKGADSEGYRISTEDKTVQQKQIPTYDPGRQLLDNFYKITRCYITDSLDTWHPSMISKS